MSPYAYLKKRGWKLTKLGWTRKGWCFPPHDAVRLQEFLDRTNAKLPPRETARSDVVRRIATADKQARMPFSGLLREAAKELAAKQESLKREIAAMKQRQEAGR